MRQEPKMYKSTKPKDAAVDPDVVAMHITDDGFHDMVNRFFQKIYTFLKWNFSADSYDSEHYKGHVFSDEHYDYNYDEYDNYGYEKYGYRLFYDD